ncbi:molecular chaperone DnaK (HSP70) [Catenuloplanes nepalensis]|uniref:Molecular chaperone DnaK (HSP70) n=1 Tax=Catenuloplanes nepalensis TaxID=587533 RepID=A0ABT9MT23_9ACTN|nr:Hsp70 family protein [Catenuloplanes nepalensis]MDP9794533.1 molecular chaperone DnaK (HSP70) [Catenuloplanes nepalensis]
MRVLAIDFGTSNTVAVVRSNNGPARALVFDSSPLLPSCVYLDSNGQIRTGRDAERSALHDPSRFEPNPKRRIDDGAVLLGGVEIPVAQLIAAVLRRVGEEAARHLGGAPDELRMTHPAQWGERRRAALFEAARLAGLPQPRLIAEPVAAASYYTSVLGAHLAPGRALAIYDLGGGTFDAAVVRHAGPAGFEVLAQRGLHDLGGLDFDQLLVDHLGRAYGAGANPLWQGLIAPRDATQRRQRTLLYDDVRGAKESLSRANSADVHVPSMDISAHVTREEFDGLLRPHLARTVDTLLETVAAARLAPTHLAGVFLVGGSSRIPLVASLLHNRIGVAPTTLEQPETVVAEGAAYHGGPAPTPAQRPAPVSVPPYRPVATSGGPAYPTSGPPQMQPPPPVMHQAPPQMHQQPVMHPPMVAKGPVAPPRPPVMTGPKRAWYKDPRWIWAIALLNIIWILCCVCINVLPDTETGGEPGSTPTPYTTY